MYNIIIFGTGKTSMIVESGLNDNVNILCYCDNDQSKWLNIHNNKQIISPEKIKGLEFDYIIIASQFNESIYNQLIELKVHEKKIFQFYKYMDYNWNYINHNLCCLNEHKDTEVIATGISYMEKGIIGECLCKKIINIANHSQDLYYDYHLIEYILEKYNREVLNFKYVFLGLSYYSFEYDMSKASMRGKVPLYYEVIGKSHHMNELDDLIIYKQINETIAQNIFKYNKEGAPSINWFNDNLENNMNIFRIDEEIAKKQALLDGNKNYPETVKENIQIFKDYLKLLKDNNIKPIVIVCPVSNYYAKHFSQRLTNEFNNIVKEVRKEYDFQFIDYFNSNLFGDEDFYDVTHLNRNGAEKFTKILNEIIEW